MINVVWKSRCAVLPGGAAGYINIDLIGCLAQSIVERILEDLRAMGGILCLLDSTRLHVLLLVLQLLHLVAIILLNKGLYSVKFAGTARRYSHARHLFWWRLREDGGWQGTNLVIVSLFVPH